MRSAYAHVYSVWVSLYQGGMNMAEIAHQYDCNRLTVLRTFHRLGVQIRGKSEAHMKYSLDSHYFDSLDSDEKCYWLGFIAADGCITIDPRGIYTLEVQLNCRDADHLERLKEALGSNRPIYQLKRGNAPRLMVNSKSMIEVLMQYGIMPRKSLSLVFPSAIPSQFHHSFIRGYFDGDGCISFSKTGNAFWSIVGTEVFLQRVRQIIIDNLEFNQVKLIKASSRKVYSLTYAGTRQTAKLCEWLYHDAQVWLPRKKERMLRAG